MKNLRKVLTTVLAAALTACAEPPPESEEPTAATPEAASAATGPTVTILEPAEGATLMGDAVAVRLTAAGVEIVPAGDTVPGTGHHHLYLDADLSEAGTPVPTVPGSVIHLGDGSSEYVFEGVAAGEHRLIAVVADGVHIPLEPWVVDTVTFTVSN